ncbi:MAG: hypothetical protein DHS20C02_10340 [Micavibrio sp.]|nr:MAG: hypothetical protein DHS20C02_10340 [Micavibrio sp.]
MKEELTLIFMRHGEKVMLDDEAEDMLTRDGYEQVQSTAEKLKQMGLVPDIILMGNSNRTQESAQGADEVLRAHYHPKSLQSLSVGSRGKFIEEGVKEIPHDAKTVLCISHDEVTQSQFAALANYKIEYADALVLKFNVKSFAELNYESVPNSPIIRVSPALAA